MKGMTLLHNNTLKYPLPKSSTLSLVMISVKQVKLLCWWESITEKKYLKINLCSVSCVLFVDG